MNLIATQLLARCKSHAAKVAQRTLRATDGWAERAWEARRYCFPARISSGEMTAILGRMGLGSFHEYAVAQMLGHFGRRNFVPTNRQAVVDRLRGEFPNEVHATLEVADKLLRGTFDVLGSGPVDMRRARKGSGARIDWRRDPISGESYARLFSQWRWRPDRMQPGAADVKGPWEIGRCQHFPTLGLAWWLTGDERYARCFADTVSDFRHRNPVGTGVQWACPMDVALRLVSWLQGISYFQGARPLGFRWWRGFLRGIVEHGRFITQNLEFGTFNGQIITSNHHLSNLVGLYWLATSFPHLDAACVWRGISECALEREIHRQILPDGGNYESSIPYHRLDLELFLSAYAQSQAFGYPLSQEYRARLVEGFRFLAATRQPSGRQPQIGDADNGRAHILSGYGRWDQENMDPLLSAAAAVLDCPELAAGIAPSSQVETLLWDREPVATPSAAPAPVSLFGDFGVAVARQAESYLLLTNGPVGTSGVGNHKHNDQLAIEWVVGQQPLIVDGGSYCYTSNAEARNQFRGVATHNTVRVAGEEQHTLRPDWLFRLMQEGEATLSARQSDIGEIGLAGSHTGYGRLATPVTHARRVYLSGDGSMVIDDQFEGPDIPKLRWQLLLYPGVTAKLTEGCIEFTGPRGAGVLLTDSEQPWRLESAWHSPGYGTRIATQSLVAERTDGPRRVTFALCPAGAQNRSLEELRSAADRFWQPHSLIRAAA